jgi:hypothetical protein
MRARGLGSNSERLSQCKAAISSDEVKRLKANFNSPYATKLLSL